MPEKIIIDTDPGIDDAFAIFYALRVPELEVLGLTTVYGNASIDQTTHNALALLEIAKADCPVAKGAADPLTIERRPYPAFVHGDDGLGGHSPDTVAGKVHGLDAADFITAQAEAFPGQVTLVPIGPLTNIATALVRRPDLASMIKRVVLMGGAANVNGNVTPAAEANVYDDPEAADLVFDADWDVVMLGLDATHQVPLTKGHIQILSDRGGEQGAFLAAASAQYFDFHAEAMKQDFCHFHDPSALVYLLRPDLFDGEIASVRVVTEGFASGKTIAKPKWRGTGQDGWDDRAATLVCNKAKGADILHHYLEVMAP